MKVHIGPYPKNDSESRKVSVNVEGYDTWDLDHTLALIIHPALVAFKKVGLSSPRVDNDDVPEALHGTGADFNGNVDVNYHARWEYVVDEMIWTFEKLADDCGLAVSARNGEYHTYQARIENGLRLFAKYYRSLWN